MSDKVLKRSEIDSSSKWRIEDIYANDELFLADCDKVIKMAEEIASFEGKVCENSDNLLEVLRRLDDMNLLAERVIIYPNMKFHEDTSESKYQGYAAKAQAIGAKLESLVAFVEPEILELTREEVLALIADKSELGVYETYINRIFNEKEHTLSKNEEALLANVSEISNAASDIFDVFVYSDMKFDDIHNEKGELVPLTSGRYAGFLQNKDREVRKEAFASMYKEYLQYINTFGAMYLSNCKKTNFYAKTRKYKGSLNASLEPKEIPESVYDNIVNVVNESLPLMHRYVSIRKKTLNLDDLHMYDVYVPMVENSTKYIEYNDAKKMVAEGLAPMGREYIENLTRGMNEGWIDVYENVGKRSGAYSWGPNGVHPYVLLNYQGKIDDVFTIAHEMGHALHSYYSDKTQPYIYAEYRIFVAEVASTLNESLLIQHLIKNTTDKKEKKYLINYFLECFKGTIFRQTMFAEFERMVHEKVDNGEVINVDDINKIYYDLNIKYFGPDMNVDEEITYEWARIPHFYSNFYVYQYATGFSAAIALSRRILEQGESAVEDYMKFLTGGSSKDPIELLKMAGVDLSKPDAFKEAMSLFEELLDQFEDGED